MDTPKTTPERIKTETASSDEVKTPKELVAEIRQIVAQYKAEVRAGAGRIAWPESIRTRAMALARLEVPKKQIADLTGIPIATIFLWTRSIPSRGRGRPATSSVAMPEPGFRELTWTAIPSAAASGRKSSVVGLNALTGKMTTDSSAGLVIEAPGGFRVSGFHSMADAAIFLREVCR
jgi:hypothetical protein